MFSDNTHTTRKEEGSAYLGLTILPRAAPHIQASILKRCIFSLGTSKYKEMTSLDITDVILTDDSESMRNYHHNHENAPENTNTN